jgi:hypothetical protein
LDDAQARVTAGFWGRVAALEPAALAAVLAASVVARLHLVTHYAINWDEFGYLSHGSSCSGSSS